MSEKATAAEKTLEILLAFQNENRPMGTSEISRKLGFHKATTSRILLTLAEYGFLSQNHKTKKFALGAKVYELGMQIAEASINTIVRAALPLISELRDQLDETIVLEIWSGNRTVVAYSEESARPLKVTGPVGTPSPPVHVTAGAKAILAYADTTQIDAALKGELTRYTQNTITDLEQLKQRLSTYKNQGFATDEEEFDEGISAVGMPIFDHTGEAVAAIVVLIPSTRFTSNPNSETLVALKATTDAVSDHLSHKSEQSSLNGVSN